MQDCFAYHYFLGGYDAEMLEIKKLLQEHQCVIHDANLQWGAELSSYKQDLDQLLPHEIPVFIELELDIPYPERAIVIDHHGKLSGKDKKSSLEQIAGHLGRKLTREQQLISANDKGHIRGMLAIGATDKEVCRVRAIDRRSQGITHHDYLWAKEAIANLKEIIPGVVFIESKTNRTAAIIDKIWDKYQTFIIKTSGEVHVSGAGPLINDLIERYEKLKKNHPSINFWSGGMMPICGFFGSNDFTEDIFTMAKDHARPVSQHVFLFPFRIEPWKEVEGNLNLKDVFNKLKEAGWVCRPFQVSDNALSYNDYSYFYDYVRTAIFETLKSRTKRMKVKEKETLDAADLFVGNEPAFVSCLFHRVKSRGHFKLFVKNRKEPYVLMIADISLRLFETGIAILAIELINNNHTFFDDIQRINDYGRRVYPQFLGTDCGMEIDAVKGSFLADKIELHIEEEKEIITEDFKLCDFLCRYPEYCHEWFETRPRKKWQDYVQDKVEYPQHMHIGRHIIDMIGEELTSKYRIEPIIDDRMFTLCWYRGDEYLEKLTQKTGAAHEFENAQEWYRFIFLDGNGCMCPDDVMRRQLIEDSTYRRWNPWTLYGVTRYSLMCLCGSGAPPFIQTHMCRQYRLMAEMLLAQRASIIEFFKRVADISRDIDNHVEFSKIAKCVGKLHSDFLGFKNRLWFLEVTPQEQGIEMYSMAMKNMDLEKQMEELKDEIKELYDYVEMQTDKMMNDRTLNLTIMASIVLPISLVLAFWGLSDGLINTIKWNSHLFQWSDGWTSVCISLAVAFFAGVVIIRFATDKWLCLDCLKRKFISVASSIRKKFKGE